MPRSNHQKSNKRAHIIEAAVQVFSRKGYAGAAVADIAVTAKIGKGTIYEYFDSKEELFFCVYEWFVEKTETAAKVSISALEGSSVARLMALSNSILGMWDEIKDVFTLTMEFWAASSSSQLRERFKHSFREMYEGYRLIIASLIREGVQHGEFRSDVVPESIAAALVGSWDALFLQAWFDERFDPQKTAQDFLDVILRGLITETDQ